MAGMPSSSLSFCSYGPLKTTLMKLHVPYTFKSSHLDILSLNSHTTCNFSDRSQSLLVLYDLGKLAVLTH